MALITDYDTLVTAITDYLARSDLSSFVPNFLQNCQGKIYRSLRIRPMETALSGTITAGLLACPTDYVALRYAYTDTTPIGWLERQSPENVLKSYPVRTSTGKPKLIARQGDNFIFGPFPDNTYSVVGIYYKLLPLLSATNTTNWFITNAPELLLYGALLEAQPFLMNDKRIATWETLYQQSYATVKDLHRSENASGSTLATRVA